MNKLEKFAQQHIIAFSTIVTLVALSIWTIEWDGNPFMGFDLIVSHIITSIIALWIMRRIGILQNSGFHKKSFVKGVVLGLPFLVLGILSSIFSNWGIDYAQLVFPDVKKVMMFTASMFMVGIAEEIVFRGLLLNHMLKKWGTSKKGTINAIMVTALVFGGIHLLNILVAPFGTVLVQAINAASAGILFSTIYLRCQNLWAVIVVHALVDWLALFLQECFVQTTSIITNELSIVQGILIACVGSLVPIIFGVLYFRRYEFLEEAERKK